ncbi:MAG TPA: type VI secretion system tube protein Hcp [Caulobacteraceae bacterium]|jgi:type VI secretion system secreted protein Hcp|nr:type VI secretion system tube protein Hcp [Caulobacteraceae bacterium]
MRIRLGGAAAAVALAIVAAPGAALAAVDAFIWFDTIPGESKDPGHQNWIELESWSFGASQPGSMASATGGAGAGKVSVHDIHVTKHMDKASPLLQQAAATGRHFPKVLLAVRKAGGQQQPYMTYTLENVFISGISAGGGGGGAPTESISMNFTKIEMRNTAGGAMQPGTALPPPGRTAPAPQ